MNKTASGLRDRLFLALDDFISKKISGKEVEGICYLSEQILKTAEVELEFQKEANSDDAQKRRHELAMKQEEQKAMKLLQYTMDTMERVENAEAEDV